MGALFIIFCLSENNNLYCKLLRFDRHRNAVTSDAHVGGDSEEMKPSGQLKPGKIGDAAHRD